MIESILVISFMLILMLVALFISMFILWGILEIGVRIKDIVNGKSRRLEKPSGG